MLEKIIVQAFCHLSVLPLKELDENMSYSYSNKQELIDELNSVFKKIKGEAINKLIVKDSKCKYCYPKGRAYAFHHPNTNELVIKYVIFKENNNFFRIEECKNNPIKNTEGRMPF